MCAAACAFGAGPAAAGAATVTLAAAGDIACEPSLSTTATECHQAQTAQLIQSLAPTAVAPLGDNQYQVGALADYRAVFAPSWGQLTSPLHPVPGNHEYNTPGATGYFSFFGPAVAGDPTKGYYSYDLGDWHLLALNANCNFVPCRAGSAQERFVRADLAAHRGCTLAYWHQPRFASAGNLTDMLDIWRALDDYRNDIVLSGHIHRYERFAPQNAFGVADPLRGSREFIVGTGGKNLRRPGNPPAANTELIEARSFGALLLTLKPGGYDWRFVSQNTTFTDSGSTACHDKVAPSFRSLSLRPRTFRSAARGASLARATGATLRFNLTEAAAMRFAIERALAGRRVGRSCVAPKRSNRSRPACTRFVTLAGSFGAQGKRGSNRLRFTGRLNGRRLALGGYRLALVPTDAAQNSGAPARIGFTIAR
ncbi:MAG: hypothetical protein QOK04_1653 [Solirubrobacteraceae bacterium]|nr:hypothetical protein [Solirubrobacteraceae bacterium]